MKKELYIVESPLQVLCSLCIAGSQDFELSYRAIVVNGRFDNAEAIVHGLETVGLFDEVHLVSPQYEEYGSSGLSCLWETSRTQQKRFKRVSDNLTIRTGYDVLFFAGPNQLTRDAMRLCVAGNGVLIDDGSGSHNGAIAKTFSFFDDIVNRNTVQFDKKDLLKDIVKRICRPFFASKLSYAVDALYLFNPSERDRSHFKNIRVAGVSVSGDGIQRAVKTVFGIASQRERSSRIVYLSLPDRCDSKTLTNESILISALADVSNEVVFRPHPRRFDLSAVPRGMKIDVDRVFWEGAWMLGCFAEDTILVGMCSSAQMTPKILFDKEPILVFTHRIFGESDTADQDDSYCEMKRRYRDKERVLAPSSLDEMCDAIVSLGASVRDPS